MTPLSKDTTYLRHADHDVDDESTPRQLAPQPVESPDRYVTKPLAKPNVQEHVETVSFPGPTSPTRPMARDAALRVPDWSEPRGRPRRRGGLARVVSAVIALAFGIGAGARLLDGEPASSSEPPKSPTFTSAALQWAARSTLRDFPFDSESTWTRSPYASIAWSPTEESLLVARDRDHTASLWDGETGRLLKTFPGAQFDRLRTPWSPDGRTLALGCLDTMDLWNVETASIGLRIKPSKGYFYTGVWSPDGNLLVTDGSWEPMRIHDVRTGAVLATVKLTGGDACAIAWSPDGTLVTYTDIDGGLHLWNVALGRMEATICASGWTKAADWNPTGKLLATADNTTLKLWDPTSKEFRATVAFPTLSYAGIHWSPDGRSLAAGSEDGVVGILDATKGELHALSDSHTGPIRALAWSPDGAMLASGGEDGTVRLWDAASEQLVTILKGHGGPIASLAWSRSGRMLASASHDGTVKLWSKG